MVITRGMAARSTVLKTIQVKDAARTCSCEEDVETVKRAVKWICEDSRADADTTVVITPVSQSMCKALLAHGDGMDEVRNEMDDLPCILIF